MAGSTRHPDTGELTYGGVVIPTAGGRCGASWSSRATRRAPCDTMNGNAALISRAVVQRVGNVDPAFVQHDGRLRLRAACPGGRLLGLGRSRHGRHLRVASRAPPTASSPGEELQPLWSIKELTPGSWAVFSRRWAGRLWPLYWLSPYVRRGAA